MDNSKLINELLSELFTAERRRLNLIIIDLNKANKQLKKVSVDGFLFGGILYIPQNVSTVVASPTQCKTTLDFSLNAEMELFLKDSKIIRDDRTLIRQMLFTLLKPCSSERDIRNALPECLVPLVQGLSKHPRADNPGYTLRGDLRAMRQFAKLTPKMEFYSATKFLY